MTEFNPDPVTRGDTFEEQPFRILVNQEPLNLTGYTIRVDFRYRSKNGDLVLHINTTDGGITIEDATGGRFKINKFATDNFKTGWHYYDVELVSPDGIKKTYVSGRVEITEDVTQ